LPIGKKKKKTEEKERKAYVLGRQFGVAMFDTSGQRRN
jgi:hypothetical protein